MPPGLDSASDTGKANGQGNGLGIGKVPPGLAKLFENNEVIRLPPGLDSASDTGKANGQGNGLGIGNIPPGQLKKLYGEEIFSIYSPDDYFDDATEDLREDSFEEKFDKMNKDSKAKEKSNKIKQSKLDKIANAAANGGPPGLAKKVNDGITDTIGNQCVVIGGVYDVTGFTAIKNGKTQDPDKIKVDVVSSVAGTVVNNKQQGNSNSDFDLNGPAGTTYDITATVNPLTPVTRTVTVQASCGAGNNAPTANAGPDQSVTENTVGVTLDGTGSSDSDGTIASYAWTQTAGTTVTLSDVTASQPTFTAPSVVAVGETLTFSLIVTDDDGSDSTADTVDITINDTGVNNAPTLLTQIPDDTVSGNNPTTLIVDLLDVLGGGEDAFFDTEDGAASLTYTITDTITGTVVNSLDITGTTLTLDYKNGNNNDGSGDITVTATDSGGKTATNTFTITRT